MDQVRAKLQSKSSALSCLTRTPSTTTTVPGTLHHTRIPHTSQVRGNCCLLLCNASCVGCTSYTINFADCVVCMYGVRRGASTIFCALRFLTLLLLLLVNGLARSRSPLPWLNEPMNPGERGGGRHMIPPQSTWWHGFLRTKKKETFR